MNINIFLVGGLLAIGLIAGGCTGAGQQMERSNALVVTQQEIDERGIGVDIYTLLQRVRPNWLRKSGPHSMSGGDDIPVYVDGMRHEDPSVLRFYPSAEVRLLRFLTPGRATARFGIGHSHGAILVEMSGTTDAPAESTPRGL